MAEQDDIRASDADRDRVADALRVAAAEGRLEPDELEERLSVAYSARTLAELEELTADLPPDEPRQARPPRRRHMPLGAVLVAIVVTLAIVVHPLIWIALWPALMIKHGGHCHRRRATVV